MKNSILILLAVFFLAACENTTGQYRHDPKHHKKPQQRFNLNISPQYKRLIKNFSAIR